MDYKELCIKYGIRTDGLKRIYTQYTYNRRFDMTSTTPVSLIMYVDPEWGKTIPFKMSFTGNPVLKTINANSWSGLLTELVLMLQKNNPKPKEELLSLKFDWTDTQLFRETKDIVNCLELDNGLYFSFNYSANHSSWVIDELLQLYDINLAVLLIHRPPFSEPKEVVTEIKQMRIEQFKNYLSSDCGLDEEKADKIINSVNNAFNKVLVKSGWSYNDFFLFDDTKILATYKSKFIKELPYVTSWNDKQIKTANRYLDYLTDFYTTLAAEAKKHKEDLKYHALIM